MSALDWLMRQLGGDPEAEGAVTTSSAIQPAVLDQWQLWLKQMEESKQTEDRIETYLRKDM
jgi:hypothetical protein